MDTPLNFKSWIATQVPPILYFGGHGGLAPYIMRGGLKPGMISNMPQVVLARTIKGAVYNAVTSVESSDNPAVFSVNTDQIDKSQLQSSDQGYTYNGVIPPEAVKQLPKAQVAAYAQSLYT